MLSNLPLRLSIGFTVMRLPSTPSLSLVDNLNTVYFNRLWNADDDHGRANFKIIKVAERLQTGAVSINQSVVGLPTTDMVYSVYKAPYRSFGRFVAMPEYTWITDLYLLTTFGVDVNAYTSSGKMIPSGNIHVRYDPVYSTVLIAIPCIYANKCTGESYPELYMTTFKDTSRTTPTRNTVFVVSESVDSTSTPAIVNQAIITAKNTYPNKTIVTVNGYVYDPNSVPSIVRNDIVEIISDPDIVGYVDIPIDDNVTGYYSTRYEEYREVLHIPKSLNPDNILITNDTLSVVIFDPITNRGIYGHQVDSHAVESITHNDFSMSRSLFQAFQNDLGATSVVARVYVRYPTKPLYLKTDVNHISDLYSLPDSEIIKQLTSLSLKQIPEWFAAHLEQSEFVNLLYQFNGFNTSDILSKFVSALGYYDVASTLGDCTRFYTYTGAEAEIIKPARLYGCKCNVIVYADGRKVPESKIGISDYSDSSFLIGFTADTYVEVGTKIVVYITEADLRIPIPFNPVVGSATIVLPNEDYELVLETTYLNNKTVWGGSTNRGYRTIMRDVPDYVVSRNNNGSYTYLAKPVHYGEQFYLIPKYGMTTQVYPLDQMLTDKKPIIIDLRTSDQNDVLIPLVGYVTLEIYINGYRLINEVDYEIKSVLGPDNAIIQTLLVVSNSDYLDLNNVGNILEVVSHGDIVISEDSGYTVSNRMHRFNTPALWSKSCGRVFAHGRLIENVSESGNVLLSDTAIPDGTTYFLQWCLPYGVSKLLTGLSATSDNVLQTKIDRVLGLVHPSYPSIVLVDHLHALYSPFLAAIVYDVGMGIYQILDDPTDIGFLNQFTKYGIIWHSDPTLGASNLKINRQFVTLAAHYTNYAVSDPVQMFLIQRLITLLLTPSELSIGDVLI